MAKGHTGRLKVLSMYRSYHGATMGAITLTGEARRLDNEPGHAGCGQVLRSLPVPVGVRRHHRARRSASGRSPTCASVVRSEGPQRIAAIVLETVVGTNGILVPPDGYLAGVRAICDEFGIMMICDEVMAGFGRCGEWFAVDHWGVTPDLIAFAKGVNSGYVPLGGVVISPPIADTFRDRVFQGGLTYSGHPLACATAVASINIFEDEGIIDHARMLGDDVIGPRLRRDGRSAHERSARCAGSACSGRSRSWPTATHVRRSTRRRWVASPAFCKQTAASGRSSPPTGSTSCRRATSPSTMRAGLDVIDEALTVADNL